MNPSKNTDTQRWFVLTYTGNLDTAVQRLSSVKDLDFYAPQFDLEQKGLSRRESWYFRNYAFVFGSQNHIYELKKIELRDFNFMRGKSDGDVIQHPYISDYEIEQLKKVEKMNDGKIPLTLSTEDIFIGDTVEILTGEFKGYTATAITKQRSKFRQVYLFIGSFLVIPLCQLRKEEFKIMKYANPAKKSAEFCLSSESAAAIIDAIKRFYGMLPCDEANNEVDCCEIAKLKVLCENNKSFTINNRLKALSLLGLAYMISGENEKGLRFLKLANAMLQENVTMVARLLYATMRFLSTSLPNHYSDFNILKKEVQRSIRQESYILRFVECAEELNTYLSKRQSRNASGEVFSCGMNQEYWFCISAPKKKTEAIRIFREKNIQYYAPIVTSIKKDSSQKNVFKDIFFVKIKYEELLNIQNEHHIFTILTQIVDRRKEIFIYSDDAIETFDYVNSLGIPNKEIIKYSAQEEARVCKSQRKSIHLGEKEVEGFRMSLHVGSKTQEKIVFLLKGVAAIAVTLK